MNPGLPWPVRLLGLLLHAGLLALPCLALGDGPALLESAPGLLCLVALSYVFLAELPASSPDGLDPTSPREFRLALLTAVGLLLVSWVALTDGVAHGVQLSATGLLGAGLIFGGARLRGLAIRGLGERFVTGAGPATGLQRAGVHRIVRHPSELGILLVTAGVALLMGSALAGIPAALLLLLVLYRVRLEDRSLEAASGDAFRTYRAEVGALLPKLATSRRPSAPARGSER